MHARASSLLCLASLPNSSRTAARLIEPPSTARHSGPPRATGWMTAASSQAGTRSANQRPTPQSTMTTTTLPARLTRPRQAPPAGADQPRPGHTALDPAGLARHQGNQAGATPQNPTNHAPHRPADLPSTRSNVNDLEPPLDNNRPFMDDIGAFERSPIADRGRARARRDRQRRRICDVVAAQRHHPSAARSGRDLRRSRRSTLASARSSALSSPRRWKARCSW